MGRSLHRRAAEALAEKWAATSIGAERLAAMYRMLRDEQLQANIDVFGQPYGGWDMGQLFALHCLATLWCRGDLAFIDFQVGSEPLPDAERAGNQDALRNLPEGVAAQVDTSQRGADDDGTLRWRVTLRGEIAPESAYDEVAIEPRRAPLEIGNTDASCTCLHLAMSGAVARWPYGSRLLTLIVTRRPTLIQRWRLGWPVEGDPDPVLDDLVEFVNQIAFTRMAGRGTARALGVRV